ncbi:16S rRNA (cytosine(1402)-N(4))-methyltransferase RsmH [Entomobacter blattae]|uniref:Ribosomal RNA small subunit methyltransferase H n=1 Tax=Entomobacter blattae TaxID=2762277 RepID=A0A7H1NNR2_9PROT|nr:16S rRNA (cytosine(1402)-N(4))-methyltransferase RsmH [Entomobacter blattae]QNT77422.1 Ribosomal RNA small subunit methyltransferase H [Entomobacter blattae]
MVGSVSIKVSKNRPDYSQQASLPANGHIPVMLEEAVALLSPQNDEIYVDATFGGGGYCCAMLEKANCSVYAIDRDPDAIQRGYRLAERFTDPAGHSRLHMLEGSFGNMKHLLHKQEVTQINGVIMDLGLSSYQLDDSQRGFSFRSDGPLDMRMEKKGPTAADVINHTPEKELADIIFYYGEERFSRRIAKAIIKYRTEKGPFKTTLQFAELIRSVVPPDRSGIDPATRTFQAIRISVNDELAQIEQAVQQALELLRPEGRLVVVSFHSLEDRIVKKIMYAAAGRTAQPSRYDPASTLPNPAPNIAFELLTHKAVRPTQEECLHNLRARSARLRALRRLPVLL